MYATKHDDFANVLEPRLKPWRLESALRGSKFASKDACSDF